MKYNSDIFVIWDLHWNLAAYYENLRFLNLIDTEWSWIWWDSKIIFLWDILADRHQNWMQIMLEIEKLKKQAKKNAWNIEVIFWNHDYKFVLFSSTDIPFKIHKSSYVGLFELRQFSSLLHKDDLDYDSLKLDQKKIYKNMISSEDWKKLIKAICNMKLVYRENDILFLHTNPTYEILQSLYANKIEDINKIFLNWLKKIFSWKFNKADNDVSNFFELAILYLLLNRRDSIPEYEKWWIYDALNELWINYIINWHNWYWWTVDTRGNIKIIDIDYSFGKYEWIADSQRSVASIKKDWSIYLWVNRLKLV